ncbi:T9SS type A sorting domain-containing protein [Hyphobacterium sp. CCMP332]|nr:T9SS type A sorting domain-containing protein [Hyphobacterium sp. CCMP332]
MKIDSVPIYLSNILKRLFFILLTFLIQDSILGQQNIGVINIKNVKANFDSRGHLFSSLNNGNIQSGFEFPRNSSNHTIFTSSFWISGVDSTTNILHTSVNTFPNTFKNLFEGPIRNVQSNDQSRNGIFGILKSDVIEFQQKFGTPGYFIPSSILNWPGNGNTSNGMSPRLAPFEDVNNNGVYEPVVWADYPLSIGEQNLYFLNNDLIGNRQGLGPTVSPLNVEIETYAYELESEYDVFEDCIFLNLVIRNKSNATYEDMFFGLWFDFDIGGGSDDYIGCDSSRNLFFAYNADNLDTDYGTTIPAQGVMILNRDLSSFIGYNNNSNPKNGEPNTLIEFNNYLRGLWKDGSSIRTTGDGTGTSGNSTKFLFNQSVNQESGIGGDRRALGNIGPFKLRANNSLCLDLVVFPAIDTLLGTPQASVSKLFQKADTISQLFNQLGYTCDLPIINSISEISKPGKPDILIFPNPTKGNSEVVSIKAKQEILKVEIYDLNGKHIKTQYTNNQSGDFKLDISYLRRGIYLIKTYQNSSCNYLKLKVE